ncbi:MAG TPA: magnesium transporter CorA family protein, partial [Woeseiaceae bacterium]|nr:magnesium transporter CorA family protein [Woeseiaceae bacterium]
MIRSYAADQGRLRPLDEGAGDVRAIWYDAIAPTAEEEAVLERAVRVNIPTREEMEEIEISSRLYFEDGAAFMTAILPARSEADTPEMAPVTFVLADGSLVTLRYHEPQAFLTFPMRAEKTSMGCESADSVLIALLEVIIDRLADILERAGRDIDRISHSIFQHPEGARGKNRNFQQLLEDIGLKGDLTSNVRDSLASLERMFAFLAQYTLERKSTREVRSRLKTLTRDAGSLTDHAGFLSQKITFLLDATLGMINIEQNATIKIFSVAAVVLLPPTLIASIYGMNFGHMPELDWLLGYPFALGLMIGSAVLSYWYFK